MLSSGIITLFQPEANKSPYQIWIQGFYNCANSNHGAVLDLLSNPENVRNIGVEDEGPVPDIQTQNNVMVLEINVDLDEDDIHHLQELAQSDISNDEHGEQAYLLVCAEIERLLIERNGQ